MPATSWTTPTSPAANATATSAWAGIVADDLKFLKNPDRARVYRDSTQSLADSTWEVVNWPAEDYDSNGLHSTVTNVSRLTVVVDGWYAIDANIEFASNSTGRREIQLRKNDTTSDATGGTRLAYVNTSGLSSTSTRLQISTQYYLSATDHVRLFAWQNSGGALNISNGAGETWLAICWLGD